TRHGVGVELAMSQVLRRFHVFGRVAGSNELFAQRRRKCAEFDSEALFRSRLFFHFASSSIRAASSCTRAQPQPMSSGRTGGGRSYGLFLLHSVIDLGEQLAFSAVGRNELTFMQGEGRAVDQMHFLLRERVFLLASVMPAAKRERRHVPARQDARSLVYEVMRFCPQRLPAALLLAGNARHRVDAIEARLLGL